jgi:hypothetical protein
LNVTFYYKVSDCQCTCMEPPVYNTTQTPSLFNYLHLRRATLEAPHSGLFPQRLLYATAFPVIIQHNTNRLLYYYKHPFPSNRPPYFTHPILLTFQASRTTTTLSEFDKRLFQACMVGQQALYRDAVVNVNMSSALNRNGVKRRHRRRQRNNTEMNKKI